VTSGYSLEYTGADGDESDGRGEGCASGEEGRVFGEGERSGRGDD